MKKQLTLVTILSTLFIGCNQIPQMPKPHVPNSKNNFTTPTDTNLSKPLEERKIKQVKQTIAKKPKKNIKLKKVEDNNFSPEYMYPDTSTTQKVVKQSTPKTTTSINKEECISMIGQDRFDRYVQMLGSESDALKRCQLIKAQS